MNEKALLMEEPKQKLLKLEEFIPNATDGLLYEFGRFLASYLNPELVPFGFVMGRELALHDLQAGRNGFTRESIQNRLVGYPPMMYALLRRQVPQIAEAIFPAEFAEKVKTLISEVNAKVEEKKK